MTVYGLIKQRLAKDKQGPKWQRFTDEELEVLEQIYAAGLNVKEGSNLMNMSTHAIRYHFNRFKAQEIKRVSMKVRINVLLENAMGGMVW